MLTDILRKAPITYITLPKSHVRESSISYNFPKSCARNNVLKYQKFERIEKEEFLLKSQSVPKGY